MAEESLFAGESKNWSYVKKKYKLNVETVRKSL